MCMRVSRLYIKEFVPPPPASTQETGSDSRRFDFRESQHVSSADLNHIWQPAVVAFFCFLLKDLLGDFGGGGGEPLLNLNSG